MIDTILKFWFKGFRDHRVVVTALSHLTAIFLLKHTNIYICLGSAAIKNTNGFQISPKIILEIENIKFLIYYEQLSKGICK